MRPFKGKKSYLDAISFHSRSISAPKPPQPGERSIITRIIRTTWTGEKPAPSRISGNGTGANAMSNVVVDFSNFVKK
jgi:hypothetical protein